MAAVQLSYLGNLEIPWEMQFCFCPEWQHLDLRSSQGRIFLKRSQRIFFCWCTHPPLWYLNRKCLKSSPWKVRRPWVKNSRSNSPAVKRTFVQSWTNYSFLSDPKSITNHSKITNQFKKYFFPERTVTNHFNYSMFNIWLTPFCPNLSCVLFRYQKINTMFFSPNVVVKDFFVPVKLPKAAAAMKTSDA